MRAVLATLALTPLAALAACGPSDNEGGCKDTLVAGDLVITEVFADYAAPMGGTGADEGKEWFEVYNASDRPIELAGLAIIHGRPDGSATPKQHLVTSITVAPGQYLTLGNSVKDLLPAYIDYGYGADLGDLFNTDGGKLELRCGTSLIDEATYESVRSGHSRQLTSAMAPDYTLNDSATNWCEAKDSEFEANNFGTPGTDNDCRPIVIGQCNDLNGPRDAIPPAVGQLVITEVMPSPGAVSDTTGEWFEAVALASFDLNGIGLDRAGDTANPSIIESTDCLPVNAGDHVVFAKSLDPLMNGGLPEAAVKGRFTFSMVGGSVATPGDVQILHDGTVIDAMTYIRSASGKALQLDPDLVDPASNDEPSNYCDATTPYGAGTDTGTPGAPNTQCTLLPPAGMCDDGGTLRAIVKPAAGQLVISELLADPAGTDTTREWVEITNTGATAFDLNGLTLGRASGSGTPVSAAKCISIAAGGFGLFARSNDPALNGMLPTPDATFAVSLVNTNGDIQVRDGMTVLDAISYTNMIASGLSRQLDPDSLDATMNDNASAAPWCPGATPYGDNQNQGTPRAANAQCP